MGIAPGAQIIVAKVAPNAVASPDSALLAAWMTWPLCILTPRTYPRPTAGMVNPDADTLFAGVYELQERITLGVAGGNEFQASYGNKSSRTCRL